MNIIVITSRLQTPTFREPPIENTQNKVTIVGATSWRRDPRCVKRRRLRSRMHRDRRLRQSGSIGFVSSDLKTSRLQHELARAVRLSDGPVRGAMEFTPT